MTCAVFKHDISQNICLIRIQNEEEKVRSDSDFFCKSSGWLLKWVRCEWKHCYSFLHYIKLKFESFQKFPLFVKLNFRQNCTNSLYIQGILQSVPKYCVHFIFKLFIFLREALNCRTPYIWKLISIALKWVLIHPWKLYIV